MKIALLQLNYIVGDIEGNALKIAEAVKKVRTENIGLCVTSELSLLGYPPKDLLLNKKFIKRAWKKIESLATLLTDCPPVLIGIAKGSDLKNGKSLYNSAVLIKNGKIEKIFCKTLLPTYDVFDENRYFEAAKREEILEVEGQNIGVTICEDIWNETDFWSKTLYRKNPLQKIFKNKIGILVNLSASPFVYGKQKIRESMLSAIAKKYKTTVVYVNQVGGNDELVFDGRSCVFNKKGKLIAKAKSFVEDILIVDLIKEKGVLNEDDCAPESEIWNALVLGTRDYVHKNGFEKVLLGLSGGIDSAVTAVIAVDALGKDNVLGVLMPSPYSSKGSIKDSIKLSRNLGIKTIQLPIKNIMRSYADTLDAAFKGLSRDVTEENIQSRIRGNLLMALSNKYNGLLLTTGNKSELAVGYCTIYGDMCGGLAVISDVPKTMIYKLADWFNKNRNSIIPKEIIEKPPSAELRPNQKDQDSLPPYEILDNILYKYVDQQRSCDEIVRNGLDEAIVKKVLKMINNAEFKRKQAAPGIKVTNRAFGMGWRMPITAKKDLI